MVLMVLMEIFNAISSCILLFRHNRIFRENSSTQKLINQSVLKPRSGLAGYVKKPQTLL